MVRSLDLFDLDDIEVDDVTTKRKHTVLQIAEMHHEYNVEWLQMFKNLIMKIRLDHSRDKCDVKHVDESENIA